MYLQKIRIENLASLEDISFEFQTSSNVPVPTILVGKNGCGKSTFVSVIANALMQFKGQLYKNCEVNDGYVYRLRSASLISHGKSFSHTKVEFEKGFWCEEWVLTMNRKEFEGQETPKPSSASWKKVGENENSIIDSKPQKTLHSPPDPILKSAFEENVVLYFPTERFEIPFWANENQVREGIRFQDPRSSSSQQTTRTLFNRAILVDTLEWIRSLCLDAEIGRQVVNFPVALADGKSVQIPGRLLADNSDSSKLLGAVRQILTTILGVPQAKLVFGARRSPTISVQFNEGTQTKTINLQSLSAGQTGLFTLFCSILRDSDMTKSGFISTEDIRGFVLVDEIDKHLHLDMQTDALPQLIKMFPSIQFVVTAHSPFFMMGMERHFANDQFKVIELPHFDSINVEAYSEFSKAFDAFGRTAKFDREVLARVQKSNLPVVLFEGKTDVNHIKTAWEKLHPDTAMPFNVEHAGGPGQNRGGAQMLKLMLEASCMVCDRKVIGVFDYDTPGKTQFDGLQSAGFTLSEENSLQRSHNERDVDALLLPVPKGREIFVNESSNRCYLAIEHYYEDNLLNENGVAGEAVVADSIVFPILENSKCHNQKKTKFSEKAGGFPRQAFNNFESLFDAIEELLSVDDAESTVLTTHDELKNAAENN